MDTDKQSCAVKQGKSPKNLPAANTNPNFKEHSLLRVTVNLISCNSNVFATFPHPSFSPSSILLSSHRLVSWWPCVTPSCCPQPSSPWQPPARSSLSKAPRPRPPLPSHPPVAPHLVLPLVTPPLRPALPPRPLATRLPQRAVKGVKASGPPCRRICTGKSG